MLGSINLSEFVSDDKQFDFDDFKHTVKIAVESLNDVLDEGLPLHPLEEQRNSVRNWRQIGLGIFGLADMLIKMNIKYGSEESIYICDIIGHVMADTAIKTSALLASKYGTYPKYNKNAVLQSPFFTKNALGETIDLVHKYGLLNSQLLTIAPTGTLSIMLGVSGGIEPIFANYYTRKTESLKGHDEYYKVYTPIVKNYMNKNNLTDDVDLPEFFITSQNIPYKNRINMQSIWQKHIDASISSTVNLHNSATVEDVENLYMYAWEKGLKGITIFRDGCKRTGILTTSDNKDNNKEKTESIDGKKFTENDLPRGYIITADDNVIGLKRKIMTGCGSMHVVAMFDPVSGELLETYLSKGSTGGCQSNLAAVSRLMSLCARAGVDIYTIVDQLQSCMACPSYVGRTMTKHDTSKGKCCPDAVSHALMDMYREMKESIIDVDIEENNSIGLQKAEKVKNNADIKTSNSSNTSKVIKSNISLKTKNTSEKYNENNCFCPVCGEEIVFEGGCMTCKHCGWSKCD